jgi:PAS domain-containing protein
MAQQPVETILVRQLADYLSVPVIVFDPERTAIFYNEPAERLLGVRFDETGRIGPEEADRLIEVSDDPSAPAEDTKRPVVMALEDRRPTHVVRWVRRHADGVRLLVEITAFPLIGQGDTLLGAVAMFWERHQP